MITPVEQVWVLTPDGNVELVDPRPAGTISIRPAKAFDEATVRVAQSIGRAVRGADFVPNKKEVEGS